MPQSPQSGTESVASEQADSGTLRAGGPPPVPRSRTALGIRVAVLLGASLFVAFSVPVGGLSTALIASGGVVASALWVRAACRPAVLGVLVPGLALLGFAAGGPGGQVVVTAAVLAGFLYPHLTPWMPKEVDHFFVPLVFFWIVLILAILAAAGLGGATVRDHLRRQLTAEVQATQESLPEVLESVGFPPESAVTQWVRNHPVSVLLTSLAPWQSALLYFLMRWVRRREGWLHSVLGHLALFKVHVRYSLVLIAGMVLLVLNPWVPGGYLASGAAPLLVVLATACFIAGVGCAGFYVWALRLQGRPLGSRIALMGLFTMLVLFPQAFAVVGVVDIWLDLRRWAAKLV